MVDATTFAIVMPGAEAAVRRYDAGSQVVPRGGTPHAPWTALFDRPSGWTGADGVYSIPLVENDRLASAGPASKTFFTFSDTFIGAVNADNTRAAGSYLIRNSSALLTGAGPDASHLTFNFRPGPSGTARPVFANNANGSWFWPVDGAVVGSDMHLFSLRMKAVSGGFGFDYEGITLFSTTVSPGNLNNAPPAMWTYSQRDDTGLFVPAAAGAPSKIFGQAVMNNSAQGGAFFPDGYVYVYGVRNDAFNKRLLVARVPREQLGDPSQYRFFNGGAWVAGAQNAQPLAGADHLSSEFSVTPMRDGRYLMVFSYDDAFGDRIAARYAPGPTGPWGPAITLYTCPEANLTPNTFVYGAKAHPALSRAGELLISYHVNSFEFDELYQNADIYRPRFISLRLTGGGDTYELNRGGSGTGATATKDPFAMRRAPSDRELPDDLDALIA
jgi:hypothetical protein